MQPSSNHRKSVFKRTSPLHNPASLTHAHVYLWITFSSFTSMCTVTGLMYTYIFHAFIVVYLCLYEYTWLKCTSKTMNPVLGSKRLIIPINCVESLSDTEYLSLAIFLGSSMHSIFMHPPNFFNPYTFLVSWEEISFVHWIFSSPLWSFL